MDTIVALATARGRAGVAVVRVSGPLSWDVCDRLAGAVPTPRMSSLRNLRDSKGDLIDQGLVLVFDEGASFTGEKVSEFHVHGGPAVISALLRACLDVPGVRTAEPGEFTKRAFFAGRLNLPQVEALGDLINAETEAQRRQALGVLEGSVGVLVESLRGDLMESLAMAEAVLDFSDEELPEDMSALIDAPLSRAERNLREQLNGRRAAEAVRDGFEVAIIGRVNAGKSSLMNTLAGRDVALTSERAGTTRDVIEVRMDIGGLPVTILDTAGLRQVDEEIEALGIERGKARARKADLRVYLVSEPEEEPEGVVDGDIVLRSKVDLVGGEGISTRTGEGVPELLSSIERELNGRARQSVVFARERHFHQAELALSCVVRARAAFTGSHSLDIACEEVRLALRALDGILGKVDVEDVLGRIFSSFCIGK